MERRQAWQRTAERGPLGRHQLAEGVGRPRGHGRPRTSSTPRRWPAYRTPGIYNANGLWQIGPMIIRWGTDEQKQRWLPSILNADEHWCQGFTEPAGRLRPRQPAHDRDPRRRRLRRSNGQKIWISSAHLAKWGLFLVRTDPDADRARGASTRASPRSSSTWRRRASSAVRSATSPARRCSTRSSSPTPACPAAYRLGDEGEGWQVAMGTLGSRAGRHGRARDRHARRPRRDGQPGPLGEPGRARRSRDPRPHRRRAHPDRVHRSCSTTGRSRRSSRARRTGPRCRWRSCSGRHLAQTLAELAVDLLGPSALLAKGGPDAVDGGTWNRLYVFQRYTSIGAGTTEVQKNIIADKAIKMPRN